MRKQVPIVLLVLMSFSSMCVYAQDNPNTNNRFAPATTVQQPSFGISINPDGVLSARNFAQPGELTFPQRAARAARLLDQDVLRPSKQRFVSLKRLAQHLENCFLQDEGIDDEALRLAGLTAITHVYILADHQDIILSGPAEGWVNNAAGRCLGVFSGAPTILLEDLAVALQRVLQPKQQHSVCGCSINPRQDALASLVSFNRTIPKAVPQRARGEVLRNVVSKTTATLGQADVVVFGIPAASHMAAVMVEADYRMKLTAVGIEPAPAGLKSFFARLQYPPRSTYQRWWFTADDHALRVSPDGMIIELKPNFVQLKTEDYASTELGQLYHTGAKPSGAATGFATAFTADYAKIAQARPVYAQLENMVDLLVISEYLQQVGALDRSGLTDSVFATQSDALVPHRQAAREVPCVANGAWKGTQMIAVAGGGVSIEPRAAVTDEAIEVAPKLQAPDLANNDAHWWWDEPLQSHGIGQGNTNGGKVKIVTKKKALAQMQISRSRSFAKGLVDAVPELYQETQPIYSPLLILGY